MIKPVAFYALLLLTTSISFMHAMEKKPQRLTAFVSDTEVWVLPSVDGEGRISSTDLKDDPTDPNLMPSPPERDHDYNDETGNAPSKSVSLAVVAADNGGTEKVLAKALAVHAGDGGADPRTAHDKNKLRRRRGGSGKRSRTSERSRKGEEEKRCCPWFWQ